MLLRVALSRPALLDIAAEGAQRLRLAGYPEMPFTAAQLHLVLPLRAGAMAGIRGSQRATICAPTMPIGGDASRATIACCARIWTSQPDSAIRRAGS